MVLGGGVFFMGEVPLYNGVCQVLHARQSAPPPRLRCKPPPLQQAIVAARIEGEKEGPRLRSASCVAVSARWSWPNSYCKST